MWRTKPPEAESAVGATLRNPESVAAPVLVRGRGVGRAHALKVFWG